MYVKAGSVTRIIASKTKIAPIKTLSIPCLELLGCLLLAQLMFSFIRVLQDVMMIDEKYYWSDSEVAIAWIKGTDKKWKPWIQSRVNKIKEISDVKSWNHVSTKINPADIGTREVTALKIADNDQWWCGGGCSSIKTG